MENSKDIISNGEHLQPIAPAIKDLTNWSPSDTWNYLEHIIHTRKIGKKRKIAAIRKAMEETNERFKVEYYVRSIEYIKEN